MAVNVQPSTGEWRHGLCNCCDSCTDCMLAYCCGPCYAFCAADRAGEGTCMSLLSCILYPWCLCCLRSNIRAKRGIDGGCCSDCIVSQCCACCAVIQMKREFD